MSVGGVGGASNSAAMGRDPDQLVEQSKKALQDWSSEFKGFIATKIDERTDRDDYLMEMTSKINELNNIKRNILDSHELLKLQDDHSLKKIADSIDLLRSKMILTVFLPTAVLKLLLDIKDKLNQNQKIKLEEIVNQLKFIDIGNNKETKALYVNLCVFHDMLKNNKLNLNQIQKLIDSIEALNSIDFPVTNQNKLSGLINSIDHNLPKESSGLTQSQRGERLDETSSKLILSKINEIYNKACEDKKISEFQILRIELLLESLPIDKKALEIYEKFMAIDETKRKEADAQTIKKEVDSGVWTLIAHYKATQQFIQELKERFSK
jgi:hypothetical protein